MKKWIVDHLWMAGYLVFIALFGALAVIAFTIGLYGVTVLGVAFILWTAADLCRKAIEFKKFKEKENNK
jgi:ABC-type nickel/cobalt efflux system permease component RcnA